jgi:hypothetical protein
MSSGRPVLQINGFDYASHEEYLRIQNSAEAERIRARVIDSFRSLIQSIDVGDVPAVQRKCSDVNLTMRMHGKTALHFAVERGALPVLKVLMTRFGAKEASQIKDYSGNTPSELAAKMGHKEMIDYFASLNPVAKPPEAPDKKVQEEAPLTDQKPIDLDPENVVFKDRLAPHLYAGYFVYSNEQMTWLRTQFQQLESPVPSSTSPLEEYLFAGMMFPTVMLERKLFGIFEFFMSQANMAVFNVSLKFLEEKGISPEKFAEFVTAFIKSSKGSFEMSKKLGTKYPVNKLNLAYGIGKGEYLQIRFEVDHGLALRLSWEKMGL